MAAELLLQEERLLAQPASLSKKQRQKQRKQGRFLLARS